jgi:hypothetical protein
LDFFFLLGEKIFFYLTEKKKNMEKMVAIGPEEAVKHHLKVRDMVKQSMDEKRPLTHREISNVMSIFKMAIIGYVHRALSRRFCNEISRNKMAVFLDVRSLSHVYHLLNEWANHFDQRDLITGSSVRIISTNPCQNAGYGDLFHDACNRFQLADHYHGNRLTTIFCVVHAYVEDFQEARTFSMRTFTMLSMTLLGNEQQDMNIPIKFSVRHAAGNHPDKCRLIHCDARSTFSCPKCKNTNVRYCSESHMELDSRAHAHVCAWEIERQKKDVK